LRCQYISSVKKAYPISVMCEAMKVSRSVYYKWENRSEAERWKERKRLIPMVKEIHNQSRGSYGTRRISEELKSRGIPCGRDKARTLMKLSEVSARQSKKFKVTTDSKHNFPIAPNHLDRNFEVGKPNRAWVSDITYVWTQEGWLYLTVIIDLYSRLVIGWSINNRIDKGLVMDALRMAIWRRRPETNLIFHTDRGSQYCSDEFQEMLKKNRMISSMSRKGNCWDNAVSESFFGSLKTERLYGSPYQTREETRRELVDYIEMFYNSRRLHSYLGYLSPKEFEEKRKLNEAA
jgi:putative transposase